MIDDHDGFETVRLVVVIAIVVLVGAIGWFAYDRLAAMSTVSSARKTTIVEIKNSGSTNTAGWDLLILTDGSGSMTYTTSANTHSVVPSDKEFSNKTFNVDLLKKNLDSADLGSFTGHCMHSVSFGSTETVIYSSKTIGSFDCYAATHPEASVVVAVDDALKTAGLK